MTGRHRAPTRNARRLGAAAVGALGASTLVLPVAPSVATADTLGTGAAPAAGTTTSSDGSHRTRGERVVHIASEQWGKPYVYGGDGPLVFDCSGLTKYVYNKVGVDLPHNSAMQYDVVEHVSKSNMRRGDLVFFYDDDGIYHVGIYASGDMMWAASHTGDYVHKQEIWTDKFVVGRP